MMDAHEAALMVQAMACSARVEGMKAENAFSQQIGNGIKYGEEAFLGEAATLEHIASALRTRAGL